MRVELLYFNHNCNSYLLIEGDKCFLIDPGFNHHNCLFNAIKERKLKLIGILLTHAHFDHIEALLDCNTIPIYIHKDEESTLYDSCDNCSLMAYKEGFVLKKQQTILLNDNDVIDFCGHNIKVIHTPFHTKGSICYYIEEKHILISGDTLFYHAIGRHDLPTSATRYVSASLTKVFQLPHEEKNDTIVYPGHGPKTMLSREYRFLKNEYLS